VSLVTQTILTIGHSNHALDAFLRLLKATGVTAIADVRSSPYSRRLPQYNRHEIKASLRQEGIDYRFYGKELGGRPSDPALYVEGTADYEAMARTESFQEGIEKVLGGSRKHRLALMCSEHDPLDCHRCLLVGRALAENGASVSHLLANGRTQSQREIEDRLLKLARTENDDFFVPSADRLSAAYRERSRRVAYAEPGPRQASEWEVADVRYS
jgi:uncharacterized protein (DUF488 family)